MIDLEAGITDPPTAPTGATCWICLEEGPDGGGEPLMRDCACRGQSAGYAHISCVVKYAQSRLDVCVTAWKECPLCAHGYQGRVALTLSNHFVAKTQSRGKNHPLRLDAIEYWAYCQLLHDNEYALSLFRRLRGLANSRQKDFWWPMFWYGVGRAHEEKGESSEALTWYEKATGCSGFTALEQSIKDKMENALRRVRSDLGLPNSTRSEVDICRQRILNAEDEYHSFKCKQALAECLANDKQLSEALEVGKECVDYFERVSGPGHIMDTFSARATLSSIKRKKHSAEREEILRLQMAFLILAFIYFLSHSEDDEENGLDMNDPSATNVTLNGN
mmetsp:Transcript_23653/g.51255  ORF Transcript_23653/g.51255 Transcript_23653/m.51255 type:complete len:333 (-) Transcript_23653:626-1624(-)